MSDDPHAVALLQLIKDHPNIDDARVFDGKVPDDTDPAATYVAVYVQVRYREEDNLPALSSRAVVYLTTHSVGATAAASRIVAGNVRASLLGVRPTVTGRTCFPIRQDISVPPSRDESTGQLVMDQLDVWRLETIPA